MIQQMMRFGIVGVICFLIDYLLLFICTEYLDIYYLYAGACSFSVSVIVNYYLSNRFVFEMNTGMKKEMKFLLFVLLSVIGLMLNEFILGILTEKGGVYYMVSKIVATIIVMIYNFATRKLLIEGEAISAMRRKRTEDDY